MKNWEYELSNDVRLIEEYKVWLLESGQTEFTGWQLHTELCGVNWRIALLELAARDRLEWERERERGSED